MSSPASLSAVEGLLETLDLETLEVNLFRGRSPQTGWQRVFGGQVIGQALVAACRTVEGRTPHSMHAYFLIGGDPKVPIIYEVDRIRDGKSFTTRRVIAIQHGQAIFSMSASFHNDEGGLSHQAKMPDVPLPEDLPSEADVRKTALADMPEAVRRYYERERPIEMRPVETERYRGKKYEDGRFHVWIRTTGRLPDDPAIHQCVLAYASDLTLARHRTGAARPHAIREGVHGGEPRPRLLDPPPVPRRRLAALCTGHAEPFRRPGLCARPDLHQGRNAGRERCAGGLGARAARDRVSAYALGAAMKSRASVCLFSEQLPQCAAIDSMAGSAIGRRNLRFPSVRERLAASVALARALI